MVVLNRFQLGVLVPICQTCDEYVQALGYGACKLIRDDSGRVCSQLYAEAVERQVCPAGKWVDVCRQVHRR